MRRTHALMRSLPSINSVRRRVTPAYAATRVTENAKRGVRATSTASAQATRRPLSHKAVPLPAKLSTGELNALRSSSDADKEQPAPPRHFASLHTTACDTMQQQRVTRNKHPSNRLREASGPEQDNNTPGNLQPRFDNCRPRRHPPSLASRKSQGHMHPCRTHTTAAELDQLAQEQPHGRRLPTEALRPSPHRWQLAAAATNWGADRGAASESDGNPPSCESHIHSSRTIQKHPTHRSLQKLDLRVNKSVTDND